MILQNSSILNIDGITGRSIEAFALPHRVV